MTIIACLLAVAIVVIVHLLLRHHHQAETAWTAERRELLNRVQRPDMIPVAPGPTFETPEPEDDFSALVGTIAEPEDGETL